MASPLALGLAACGGTEGGGETAKTAAPAKVTLYSRTNEQEAFPEVIRTHAAAGTLADVLYLQNLVLEGHAVAGNLQPIDALLKRDKVDTKQWWEAGVRALNFEGKQMGLPARGQIQHFYLYYTVDTFRKRASASRPTPGHWTTW